MQSLSMLNVFKNIKVELLMTIPYFTPWIDFVYEWLESSVEGPLIG